MFSWARPDSDEMMRNAASTRSVMAASAGPIGSGVPIMMARSLIARHASGENRSRIIEADERAAPAR
jgi:hypothetical protein